MDDKKPVPTMKDIERLIVTGNWESILAALKEKGDADDKWDREHLSPAELATQQRDASWLARPRPENLRAFAEEIRRV